MANFPEKWPSRPFLTGRPSRSPPRVILIDGDKLARLMIDHGVGVSIKRVLELKRIDEDYFLEGED